MFDKKRIELRLIPDGYVFQTSVRDDEFFNLIRMRGLFRIIIVAAQN